MNRIWCCILALSLALATGAQAADPLPWLHADGTRILNEAGQPVVLRGVNLGGWLVEEMWMMPFVTRPPAGSAAGEVKDHVSLWRTVEQRLGPAERDRVRTALRDAWITEADFDRIRRAGMNHVRLPFTYDLLEEKDGFAWLDKALAWARGSGLYVVLDLHGAPGRQSRDHHTGEEGVNRLFQDPAMVERTERVWAEVARRYRDHPEVAAYDLLNEPMGAPEVATLYLVQDRLIRAIRAVDPRHLIIVEDGYKGFETFPRPALAGWQGIILSAHHYRFDAKGPQDQVKGANELVQRVKKLQATRPVPFYLGEFQQEPHGSPATMSQLLAGLDREGISWAAWTYKTAMRDGGGGMWGWYHASKPMDPLNPFRDSADDLVRKVAQLRSERLTENQGLTRAYGQGSR